MDQREDQTMIEPTYHDVGRKVIYQAGHPNAMIEEGIITSFNDECVFIRYTGDSHSKGTSRQSLNWLIRSRTAPMRQAHSTHANKHARSRFVRATMRAFGEIT